MPINTVRDIALAEHAEELKRMGYHGCVRKDGKPCHCAKIVSGSLTCGPTKDRVNRTKAEAARCGLRTIHAAPLLQTTH